MSAASIEEPALAAQQGAGELPRPMRVAVVGISERENCGVRDHATLLSGALAAEGIDCSLHWLQRRRAASLRGVSRELGGWRRGLAAELAASRPHAILLHYSVFPFSYKGLPVFVPSVLATLRGARVPVVTVLHEYAYPWGYGGWRGVAWAISQRAAMIEVMRTSSAVLATAEHRVSWLGSRRWLPRRPALLAPVFSNLPDSSATPPRGRREKVVGLFGYAYQGAAITLVLDAVEALAADGTALRLLLLGAPGPDSQAGEDWRAQAQRRGLGPALAFTGALPAQELADALAECDVLLFADTFGPSGRKGTLAGSLASGRPVVALDGPLTWRALVQDGGALVVPGRAHELADALAGLLADEPARDRLGARGRSFYEREMALPRTAAVTRRLLAQALAAG